ncbi:MAG: diguanylate cyclase, partial [Acidobacteriota bacterium]
EFTILLERTDGGAALQLAERLRVAVEALDFVYDGQNIPLTASLGVAAFPELMIKTASELLLLADEALYEAKERGRNQCLLHVGKGAFRAYPGAARQESQTSAEAPA